MIPKPLEVRDGAEVTALAAGCAIAADDGARDVARLLRDWLEPATGWEIPVLGPGATGTGGSIELRTDGDGLGDEGYELRTTPDRVVITGSAPAGVFYGVQSLRQLLPAWTLRSAPTRAATAGLQIPATHLVDQPRFAWRGTMLDVARHYLPKHWILRLVDLLALHKLNVLHLHLTDDQGWRIAVDRYPRLTEVGAWRRESPAGHHREGRHDGTPHGGFYTKDDLAEIVAYAARRFVTVVPEIDLPGHSQAAIAAYPELGNLDTPLEVGTDWGVIDHVLNVEDATVAFYRDVLDELIELFPGSCVHLGGDECPTVEWEASPRAQELRKQRGLGEDRQLEGWFLGQLAAHLERRGRRMVGWDEILEGGAPAGAVVMSWRGEDGGIQAARQGLDVVMAPNRWTYFDYGYADDPREPLNIGGAISVEHAYSYEPLPSSLDEADRAHILGAQCQLWTEYVADPPKAEYQYFPRLCAFAETVWSAPDRSYEEFEPRLVDHLARLEALDVNYRPLEGPTLGQMATWTPTGR